MADFQARLAALRERFVAQTGRQAKTMTECVREGRWAEARDICHVLAGGAGMFGFGALGDAAREVEEAVDAGLEEAQLRDLAARLLEETRALVPAD